MAKLWQKYIWKSELYPDVGKALSSVVGPYCIRYMSVRCVALCSSVDEQSSEKCNEFRFEWHLPCRSLCPEGVHKVET